MARITLDIPDAIMPRVVNGIARQYGYQELDDKGNPNPESKAQFARRMIIRWIKKTVQQAEVEAARDVAGRDAAETAEEEIVIT